MLVFHKYKKRYTRGYVSFYFFQLYFHLFTYHTITITIIHILI